MKWALIMFYFQLGAYGGWAETDRLYFPTQEACIEAKQKFDSENPRVNVLVKCRLVDANN